MLMVLISTVSATLVEESVPASREIEIAMLISTLAKFQTLMHIIRIYSYVNKKYGPIYKYVNNQHHI
jgi:hypothetical protein